MPFDGAGEEDFIAHAGLVGVVVDESGAFLKLRLENGVESWFERKALGMIDLHKISSPEL